MYLGFATLEDDAVLVESMNGKPLVFYNLEQCRDHVDKNFNALHAFGRKTFKGALVKSVGCYRKETGFDTF
tara:strand:- start:1581 stop:1793 length:213 start_codon:yes stop_codon:yes gene_type:complete